MTIRMPNGCELVTNNQDVITSLINNGGVEVKAKKTAKKSVVDVASAPTAE